jgi:signal transduction histidine kinase
MTKHSSAQTIAKPAEPSATEHLARAGEAAKSATPMDWSRSTLGPLEFSERKQRILVADDNVDMCEYLGVILRPHWEVELVEDGQAALASAIDNPPDLILSDVMMPEMDGVTLVRALRENTKTAGTPVILLSARGGEEAVIEGLETLADDYMVKPFSSRELLTRIRTHLRMSSVRQRLQAELVIADRMSAVGLLAAGVAHEVNTPLAVVISNLDLLLDELRTASQSSSPNASELELLVNEARQGAERVAQIVSSMKTFARAGEERRTALDVRPLLALAVDVASNGVEQRARIVKNFSPVPLVEADEARISQVFVNLLVNAVQSIPEGDVQHNQVELSTRTDTLGRCVVEINDTGRGIAPAILDRIFDPFFTTKAIGEGTGLGLSICHRIVSAIGGELTAQSEPGVGSTFRIVLPPAAVAVSQEQTTNPMTVPPSSGVRGRVLIVDDEPMVGALLRRILDKQHDVTCLADGKQALELLLSGHRYDVILCDLMMPGTNGMDIYAALSSAVPEQLSRLVFVSGGAVTPRTRKFIEDIPNQLVEKPFSADQIRTLVRALLDENHACAQAAPG